MVSEENVGGQLLLSVDGDGNDQSSLISSNILNVVEGSYSQQYVFLPKLYT